MSAVTTGEAWPGFGGPITVAELDRMPSDGHRYELLDGVLVMNRKKASYEKFGVPSYWIVDPEPARPEITVFELGDHGYVLAATSTQPLTVSSPFPVTITPADLTKGLPR